MSNPLRRALDWNTQYQEDRQNNAAFAHYALVGGTVRKNLKKVGTASECHAEILEGGQRQRMTATRIGAGALLAGPVGAIIGGMAKKDLSKSWVIITTPAGTERVEFKGKDSPKAHEFVMRLESEAARQETMSQG